MEKGQTNNPNGRPKGTPNKITSTVRNWLLEIINGNREQFANDLQKLEPKERLEVVLKLLPYILPKVESANEVEGAAYNKTDVVKESMFDGWSDTKNTIKRWYEQPVEQQGIGD